MKLPPILAALALLPCMGAPAAWADQEGPDEAAATTVIDIAGHDVPVVAGGLYDRYRSNPPLSVIERESPELDLSWFRTLEKTRVDIGFESYSPNFYYENSRVTAIFTADLERLRELMPAEVLEAVQPLQIWPGRGLVAVTAYAYHYCDNDRYNEFALSIVTSEPGTTNLGPISLIGQALNSDFWGYVLKLPVDTELARVRGVEGYNLPKWLTRMDYRETDSKVVFEIADAETGKVDLVLETEKLGDVSTEVTMVTNSFVNPDRDGELISGYATSRQLEHAASYRTDTVDLQLSEDGSLSRFIRSLELGRMLKYEYVPSFQSALYAPRPLTAVLAEKR